MSDGPEEAKGARPRDGPSPPTMAEAPRRARSSRSWRRARSLLRPAVLLAWAALLVAFWLGARGADGGPLGALRVGLDGLARHPWAAAALLGLYLARPLLLVPITVLNLASGFVLGAFAGVPFAMAGTLLSASAGYGVGRFMGDTGRTADVAARSPIGRALRRRSFESVVAGGLMYLHADMVNIPAGLVRMRFGLFLSGIALGNALTMTTAVLTGASVEGRLVDARVSLDLRYLALAAVLFAVSLALAYALRRGWRARA